MKITVYAPLLKKSGMSVRSPFKADLEKVGQTMLQEWLQRAGPDGQALYDAYRKL